MSRFKPSSINFAIKKALKLKTYSCHTCWTAEWMPCAPPCLTLHQFFFFPFFGTLKVVPLQFPTFRESFPPLSGSPGVLDSATALGIIKALLQNIWHRSTSCHILQAMHLGNDRSGNVCQFSTAGSNGSSISLPKWPAFTLRLYVILFVPVRVKLTVIQLTNSTPWGSGDRDYTGPESMALSLFSLFSVSRKALIFYLFCEILCAISLTCCKVMMTLFLSCYSHFLLLLRQERCKISYTEI